MSETGYATLLIEQDDGVLTITMNRPEAYNALNAQLKDDLQAALKAAARDETVRCLVLTGAGKAFCSGQDLKEPVVTADGIGDALRRQYNPIARLLYGMEKPVIAAVNGVAAGAGASLALLCDLRVMAEGASIRLAFSNIGLIPDSGATFTLPALVGRGLALEIAYTGRAVEAEEAARIGLANLVTPNEELRDRAHALARALAERPTRALGLTKRAINRAMQLDLDGALDYEAHNQAVAAATHDFAEGVAAFREKRRPQFSGR